MASGGPGAVQFAAGPVNYLIGLGTAKLTEPLVAELGNESAQHSASVGYDDSRSLEIGTGVAGLASLAIGFATGGATKVFNLFSSGSKALAKLGSQGLRLLRGPAGLARQNPLYRAALEQHGASDLTRVGRELTKHPEVIGATKSTLRQTLRSDASVNDAARLALKDIMRNGVTTTPTKGRYGQITQIQIPGGFGARWYANGKFIGFINP